MFDFAKAFTFYLNCCEKPMMNLSPVLHGHAHLMHTYVVAVSNYLAISVYPEPHTYLSTEF